MDLGTVVGVPVILALLIGVGIGPSKLPLFIDIPSMAIVVGGTSAAIFVSYPPSMVKGVFGIIKNALTPQVQPVVETIKLITSFAEQARREGILSLEARTEEVQDEFLKKGIQLAVDGTEPDLIKDILTTEIEFIEERHDINRGILDSVADLGPAFGMIGTLVGLVLMLANMSDPANIGPAMAIALLTTLYGAIIANVFFIPFSFKLKVYSKREIEMKNMMLEGIMSLQSGDNPRIVEWKLTAFVDPVTRLQFVEENGDG
jgi:chemotaxis protein MotA